jgi:hypothetical protein
MVEHREIKLRFLAPGSHHGIVLGSFSLGDVRVGEIWNIKQEIALAFLGEIGLPDEFGDFIANLSHFFFDRRGIFSSAASAADFLAQPFSVGIALLKRGFHFPPLRIYLQHFVDPDFIAPAARRQPALDEIGLFTNETDIEHAQQLSALPVDRKSKANESA